MRTSETPAPAIAIVLGTDDDGNFVSVNVWAADSIQLYSSYDLNTEESKKWLSKIKIEEGKKYYSLNEENQNARR